ncbi:MAG TPA: ABC transporter permease [Opitutaceae bacterium]|nr:ABC transporter permease [Opitutaceae bacterium]
MRLALRSLSKNPGFTTVAVLTLALGLGANTAIFSAVYSILLKPLPFPAQDRLVSLRTMVKRETWERRAFCLPDFHDYRAQATQSFEAMAAWDGANFNLMSENDAARIRGDRVSHGYFDVLGVPPALGRTFTAREDNAPDLAPLAVLSHDFWRTRFHSTPGVIGQRIKLTDVDYTIIGVMPAGFHGLDDSTQLWVPMTTIGAATWNNRGNRGLEAVGRLKPGVTLEQAQAELAAVGLKLAEQFPQSNANYSADVAPLRDEFFGRLRQPLLVLLGAVALVLVITCVNVANLLLVRLASRRREIGIRISLGASRAALARMFLGESLLLGLLGGTVGVILATWLIAALKRFTPVELPAFVSLELHWPAFAFAGLVALLCSLAIGALPALLAARIDLNQTLKDAGRSGHSGAVGARMRSVLVTAELALSLALLVASSLFIRSFVNLISQAPGYRTEQIVSQRVMLPPARYDREAQRQFARTLLERAAALPGVQSAALATDTPLDGNSSAISFTAEGSSPVPAENEGRAYLHVVTPGFFSTAGIALLRGETFAASYAANSDPVVLVSEGLARRYWPDGDAVGKRLKRGRGGNNNAPWFRIVGVVAETKYRGLVANPTRDPDVYLSLDQNPSGGFAVMLHTATPGRALGQSFRQLVMGLDANVPVFGLATIEERIANRSGGQRFSAQLMGAFAGVALLLAAIGLYGVVSFSVGQRTQEIGVRMALGARPIDILRLVFSGTSRLIAAGLVGGAALAFTLTRFIETLLFNVNPRDPLTYAAVGATLAFVALLATWLPARRAARVDPMTALRTE